MGKANGIYRRSDNRWEARYKKGIGPDGRAVYGSVYGATREEVEQKRLNLVGDQSDKRVPTELNLLILGAGSHGRDIMEIAESLHVFNKISFLDDIVEGKDIIGRCKDAARFRNEYPCAFVAIGDNKKRKQYASFLKDRNFLIPKLVAPTATISSNAKLGEGTVIMSQANLGAANIGKFCIIAPSCTISSDVEIEDHVRIDSGAIIPRGAKLPNGIWVKSGEIYQKRTGTV